MQSSFILFSHLLPNFSAQHLFSFSSFPPPAHTFYHTQCYTTSSPQKQALTTIDFTEHVWCLTLKKLKQEKSVYSSKMTYIEIFKSRVAKKYWILTITSFQFTPLLFRGAVALALTPELAFSVNKSSSNLQDCGCFPFLSFSLSAWSVLNGKCAALLCTASGSQFAHYVSWDSCLWLFGTHLPLWGFIR